MTHGIAGGTPGLPGYRKTSADAWFSNLARTVIAMLGSWENGLQIWQMCWQQQKCMP
jgi:hypothetical protein